MVTIENWIHVPRVDPKFAFILFITLIIGGCSGSGGTKDGGNTASVEDRSISADEMNEIDDQTSSSGLEDDSTFAGDALDDPNSPLSVRVIYFEYDSAEVKEEFRSSIEAHARYLAENASVTMTLEGHGDERGTREYNLALGERRALSVRRQLVLLGAAAGQVKTVSYGEERPAADGHDEHAYGLNRRVEIYY